MVKTMKRKSTSVIVEDESDIESIDLNEEEADSNSETGSDQEEEDNEANGNAAWADAMSKVLRTTKPKKKKSLILSRAKKLSAPGVVNVKKEDDIGFEIEGEIKEEEVDEKPDIPIKQELSKKEEKERKIKKKEWDVLGRIKPDVAELNREKALSKIATKGVIQLFNTVTQHQKTLATNIKKAGKSERKKDKVLESVDKTSFLDLLMGPTRSKVIGRNNIETKPEVKDEDEEAPIWPVLKDDYLVGKKMKDWNKPSTSKSDDDDDDGNFSGDFSSDSD